MPPQQYTLAMRQPAAGGTPPRGPRHRRRPRAWLVVTLALAAIVALGVAGTLLSPGSPRTTLDATAANATATPESSPAATSASPSPSASASLSARPSASAKAKPHPRKTSSAPAASAAPQTLSSWPNADNTGTPAGVTLHSCDPRISSGGTYDACTFSGDVLVLADNVRITRSLIKGSVNTGSGTQQRGLVISDTTIDCGCLADETHTPPAISESNYTLLRVNIFNAGHGASVKDNVVIQDSYIHGLGANTDAHKDGIYAGDGSNVVIRHNNITCNDGSSGGCTSAIGLLDDFSPITYWTIDHNLLNTNGSFCFYGSGGPQKNYTNNHIVFTNNHFGKAVNAKCGYYGPVTYFESSAPGNIWSGNVWDDTGEPVGAAY